MEAELTEMVGAHVFQRLVAYLRQRDRLRAQRVALPHPAVRYPKPVAATGFSSVEEQFENGQVSDGEGHAHLRHLRVRFFCPSSPGLSPTGTAPGGVSR